ncbi:hypothetical protein C8R46DRAFT_275314 [Mycena filopes]|nr:hypothetical protein C8R46DRAFT_275314 [Mycena filopes]
MRRSIQDLRAEEQIKKRLRSTYYPVLTLPNELVSEIFIHFLPPYPLCPPLCGILSPTVLTHICRHWREIAISTPRLWRAMSFEGRHQTRMAKLWLERSGQSPLSIQTDEFDGDACIDDDEILEAIIPHQARWEYISFHLPPERAPLPSMDAPMPILRELELHIASLRGTSYPLAFRDAPRLTSAILWDFDYPTDLLPWSQLTPISLIAKDTRACTEVLRGTPNLVHCELVTFAAWARQPHLGPDIRLPHLESLVLLHFAESSTLADDYILRLTLPALRRLQIPEEYLHLDPVATLASFIAKSGCKLEHLHVTGERLLSSHEYHKTFPTVPTISFNSSLTDWECQRAWGMRRRTWSMADFDFDLDLE